MNKKEIQCKYPLCVNYKPDVEIYCCGSCQWRDWKRLQNRGTEKLTVKDLKRAMEQYDESFDDFPVVVELSLFTAYRIDKCQIEPMEGSDDLYKAVSIKKDTDTKTLILSIE